jgi:streptogramin lyase
LPLLLLLSLLSGCGALAPTRSSPTPIMSQPTKMVPSPTREVKGTITEFPLPLAQNAQTSPLSITAGSDGNLWFTEIVNGPASQRSKIGRVTPTGTVSEFPLPTPTSVPTSITQGPDGTLWLTVVVNNQNGKIDHLT